jgi:guanine nucleotide-binding protein G(i) subunit alpha
LIGWNDFDKGLTGKSGIIYVASLSEYNQKCYEDDKKNRMLESLEVFEELLNSEIFKGIPILLLLNKLDIFTQKISKKDLSCFFPEYKGGNDLEAAIEFVKQKYKSLVKENPERLQIQVINSMDEDSVINAFKGFLDFNSRNI